MQVSALEQYRNAPSHEVKAPIKREPPSPKEERRESAKKQEVSTHQAEKAAQQLNRFVNNSMKFVVRDPTSVGVHNVIIQVVNEKDEVVATIPSEEVLKFIEMSERLNEQHMSKGLILSNHKA